MENVGGKWHFISEAQLLTSVITGGDPFWIKAVARFPLTSVGLGLKIWSCRERWLLMILHREVLMELKTSGICLFGLRTGPTHFCSWLFLLYLFHYCGNMLICLFFVAIDFYVDIQLLRQSKENQVGKGWEVFIFFIQKSELLIWRARIASCDRH